MRFNRFLPQNWKSRELVAYIVCSRERRQGVMEARLWTSTKAI